MLVWAAIRYPSVIRTRWLMFISEVRDQFFAASRQNIRRSFSPQKQHNSEREPVNPMIWPDRRTMWKSGASVDGSCLTNAERKTHTDFIKANEKKMRRQKNRCKWKLTVPNLWSITLAKNSGLFLWCVKFSLLPTDREFSWEADGQTGDVGNRCHVTARFFSLCSLFWTSLCQSSNRH